MAGEAGLYVAQDQGFFAREGLNVKIVSMTGHEAAIGDLQSGRAQLAFTGYIGATSWVRSHPGTVAAFLRALDVGQQLADTDRPAVEQSAVAHLGISPLIGATMAIDRYPRR